MPSATKLVEQLLDELIEDSPESAFERTVLPKGSYDFINTIDFRSRDVLVGVLSKAEQLQVSLQYKFYHIPCKLVAVHRFPLRYIALYQSNQLFKQDAGVRYYGEILTCQKVRRSDISELPTSRKEEPYYMFMIKEWKKLDKTIASKERGIRTHIYTNLFLLENAEYIPELNIRSKEEYRLYMELKRLASVDIKSNDRMDEGVENSFCLRDAKIMVEDYWIKIWKNGDYEEFKIEDFAAKPRSTMLRVKKFIE